jgi:2,3,4,5-tetrahydropyridine-2-carboxylate N-succinyltransferase
VSYRPSGPEPTDGPIAGEPTIGELGTGDRETVAAAYTDLTLLDDAGPAVMRTIAALDRGEVRVAEKIDGDWVVNEWVKQAIMLYLRIARLETMEVGPFEYHDKIPTKHNLAQAGIRVVPPGTVRYGAFCEPGVVVMPGYVNIGAHVGSGTMVDTWATVGSCAQIGRDVHLSGGVGIGGVLEPPNARPVIVEDGAFIGSRSIITEGVIVEEGAVLGANTTLSASIPIIDVRGPEPVEIRGRVPARAVVVPGTRAKEFPAGTYHLQTPLIIGTRNETTDRKTSLNEVLRVFGVDV